MFTVVIARSKEGGLLNLPFPLGGWASDFDRREKKLMECKMGEAPHILGHYITLVDTMGAKSYLEEHSIFFVIGVFYKVFISILKNVS